MDATLSQLQHLADRLEGSSMIDPVEFGEIKGAVASLQAQLADMKAKQALIDQKLDLVLDRLSEARGGWKLLVALGGAASTLGAGLTWIATHAAGKGAP
jgi:hypothetical protein